MRNANVDSNGDDIRHSLHGDADTDADEYGDGDANIAGPDAHASAGDGIAYACAEHT